MSLHRSISLFISGGTQTLSPPLTVSVTPSNTHPPLIGGVSLLINYTEGTQLVTLAGVTLSDADETCDIPMIVGAEIELSTTASDNEALQVGIIMQRKL